MTQQDLVSVIIPAFNRAGTIRRAVVSVLNQSHRALEVIVVDDASTDGTVAEVRAIEDPRVRLIEHPSNRGVGAARNTGVAAASGRFVAFQDSDDEWLIEKLELQLRALAAAPAETVAVYCTKIVFVAGDPARGAPREVVCLPAPAQRVVSGHIAEALYGGNLISTQTLVARRDVTLEVGGFDARLRNSVDWDFVIRLAERGPIAFAEEGLVMVYPMPDSVSALPPRKSVFSRMMIVNKMRRRGVPARHLARHYGAFATQFGHYGKRRASRRLLRSALAMRPTDRALWLRLVAEIARPLLETVGPWRGQAAARRLAGAQAPRA